MWQRYCLRLFHVILLISLTPAELTSSIPQNPVINDVTTFVDISTGVVNIEHKITLTSGDSSLQSFIFLVDSSLVDRLSYINATGSNVRNIVPFSDSDNSRWEILFKKALSNNRVEKVVVNTVFTHVLKPYPTQIRQNEVHRVLYKGPVSIISPYLSLNHTSYFKLGDGSIEEITTPTEFDLKLKSHSVTYVSKLPIQPNKSALVTIHFQHNVPFLTARELYRTITISHWGNINVIEEISLENCGAKFYGPYHRQIYDDVGTNKVKYFTSTLPSSAFDIVMYDEIGRISSFTPKINEDCVELEIYPRFILYGGWKVKYFISYNVPSYEYLFSHDDNYVLKMRIIDNVFNDMVIDMAVVKIILPEGSEQLSLQTPYQVKEFNRAYHFSYLDIVGKPVITFSKTNLVEQHIEDFIVTYKFSKIKMFFEPMYVIIFIELLFMVIMAFIRIDLSIVKEEKEPEIGKIKNETATVVRKSNANKTKRKTH